MADKVLRNWTHYGYNREHGRYGDIPTDTDILWEVGDAGYEWEMFALVRREVEGQYQYASYIDGGCSCNHAYMDPPSAYSLEWHYDKAVPKAALQKALRDSSYFLSEGDKAEARASLRNA
jgi:hypothetical protein